MTGLIQVRVFEFAQARPGATAGHWVNRDTMTSACGHTRPWQFVLDAPDDELQTLCNLAECKTCLLVLGDPTTQEQQST